PPPPTAVHHPAPPPRHPLSLHDALPISSGTPVYAANRGTVSLVGMHCASGNLVLIDHPGGIQTGYAHLSKFAPGLAVGDKVGTRDRKSTRLNSSHVKISYAVFCLKKKTQ